MSRLQPNISLEGNRLYYIIHHPRIKIDVTPVYLFCKSVLEHKVKENGGKL